MLHHIHNIGNSEAKCLSRMFNCFMRWSRSSVMMGLQNLGTSLEY